jgi:hypothetical protein
MEGEFNLKNKEFIKGWEKSWKESYENRMHPPTPPQKPQFEWTLEEFRNTKISLTKFDD